MFNISRAHRLNEFVRLTPDEIAILQSITGASAAVPRNHFIHRQGYPATGVHLLYEGWALSCIVRADGRQQITKIHVPGDLLGVPSMCLVDAADTIVTVTPARIGTILYAGLMSLFTTAPRIAAALFMSTQRERVALMDALTHIGRGSALSRLAATLVDLHTRLSAAGLVRDNGFDMPITQERLGDHVGLTAVHVNRQLRVLRERGLVHWQGQRVTISNVEELAKVGLVTERRYVSELPWLPD